MPFKIPVLMYHSVSNDFDRLSISINNFEKHIRILKLMKFNIISFDDDFKKYKKPLIITFDDGYEDNFINALPILLKNNIVATCFLVSDLLGRHNVWDEKKDIL
jgi:peptidoglycan/xylan/chitin deacetylase (PgdA/CDA1 family)